MRTTAAARPSLAWRTLICQRMWGREGQWERCLRAQLRPRSAVRTQLQASGKLGGFLDPVTHCPHLRVGTVVHPSPRLWWKLSA